MNKLTTTTNRVVIRGVIYRHGSAHRVFRGTGFVEICSESDDHLIRYDLLNDDEVQIAMNALGFVRVADSLSNGDAQEGGPAV